jgi:GlcNAc-P-P-Und epimerase
VSDEIEKSRTAPARLLVTGSSGFIGARFMTWCRSQGIPAIGLDIRPQPAGQLGEHVPCDIVDRERLVQAVKAASPTCIVHLAARTDLQGKTVEEYPANSVGVSNLMHAIREAPSVERCLFTSSQLVCRVGYVPSGDRDYCPSTPYGESKVLTETLVREGDGGGVTWCILRPTTIWGAGMNAHYASFFGHLRAGRYFHMGTGRLRKSYGYVGNTVFQIGKLAGAPASSVHRKVFYLADHEPLSLRKWIDDIARGMGRRPPRTLPLPLCRVLARAGDLVEKAGLGRYFPLNTFRLNNILTEYQFDLAETRTVCGDPPHGYAEGVAELVAWVMGSRQAD